MFRLGAQQLGTDLHNHFCDIEERCVDSLPIERIGFRPSVVYKNCKVLSHIKLICETA